MISLDRKFYIKNLEKDVKNISISGDEKHHLEVLRPKVNDEFRATNGRGVDFLCKIEKITGDYFNIRVINSEDVNEYPLNIHLFFGVTKRKKWEWLIEKATEMGVLEFTPLITKNNQNYAKGFYKKKKQERFNKKVIAAMKQSRRSFLPSVNEPVKFDELKSKEEILNNSFLLSFNGNKWKSNDFDGKNKINLIVGPEGGLTDKEEKILLEKKTTRKSMGLYTLKTETAALKAVSLMTYFMGDF